jgi:hypothetical protein
MRERLCYQRKRLDVTFGCEGEDEAGFEAERVMLVRH